MKKRIFNILSFLPIMLLLAGCTEEVESLLGSSSREVTLNAFMPSGEPQTRVGLSQSNGSLDLIASWQNGDQLQVYVVQDNQKFEVGKVDVGNISNSGKQASFSFTLPKGVDVAKDYHIYAFCGINGYVEKSNVNGWDVFCNMDMTRTKLDDFKAPMFGEAEMNSKSSGILQMRHFATYELLHVKNTTNSQISFRHFGFDSDLQWYCARAGVSFNSYDDFISLPSVWDSDYESETLSIAAGSTASIISCYLPSSYKMKNAYLYANINGEMVKSANKKSSNIDIERAHAYHLYVTWDGKELKFDNGDITEEKIIAVSTEEIDFGPVDVGSTGTGKFVVSNKGNTDLTFYVEETHGVFDIPESGKNIVLAAGKDMPFDVMFKPTEPDKNYSLVVYIGSDAMNGSQYLTLKGSSNKVTEKKIAVEPSYIDFGSVAVETSKTESFVVHNIGADAVTFRIENTYGDFNIPESGMTYIVEGGRSVTFSVTFTPQYADVVYDRSVAIYSDADNGTQYLRLIGQSVENRIGQVIPDDIRDQMDPYIHIYDGANPPNIEGDYLMSPVMLYYDSETGKGLEANKKYMDTYLRFTNQDMRQNTIDYQEKEGTRISEGKGAFISGEGNKFSVFFNVESVNYEDGYNIYTKEALVISGIKTESGIKDLEYAFVIVEKNNDIYHELMDVGDFRVVIDGDYMSYYSPWSYAKKKMTPRVKIGSGKLMRLEK